MLAAYVVGIACAVLGQTSELTYDATFSDGLTYPARLAPAGGGGLYVTDQQSGKIIELDATGTAGPTYDIPELPVGIAVHPSGDVFISRLDGQVGRYNSSFVLQEVLDPAPCTLVAANDLAVHPTSEKLYVVDSGGHQVVVFWDDPVDDPDMGWGFYGSWGTAGSGMMELMTPQAITLDTALGRVIVADTDNSRVQVFDTEGIAIDRFGYRTAFVGMDATAWVARTAGLAVDSCSNVYLADALMGTVRAFDADGQDLDLANPAIGYGPGTGELRNPSDVMIEGGKLYVTSTYDATIEVFDLVCTPGGGRAASDGLAADLTSARKAARQGVKLPANPFDIVRAANTGTYASDLDLNRDRAVDMTDVEIAVAKFGGTTMDSFLEAAQDEHPYPDQGPHTIEIDNSCYRCHAMDGLPGGLLSVEGQENLCLSCHTASGVAMNKPISAVDVGNSHPRGIAADSGDVMGPDPDSLAEIALHLDDGNIRCGTCHEPMTNAAAAPYLRASIGDGDLCGECHIERDEWAVAGHADREGEAFIHYDWTLPNRSSCRKCHSGLGYIDFAAGVPEDEQRGDEQVHSCVACHDVHENSNADFLRVYDEVELPGSYLVTDAGPNATCMVCHEGRRTPGGYSLAPHYLLGGVMLEGINGEEFGNTSLANSTHTSVAGCVNCHMADGPGDGNPGAGKVGGHTFNMSVHDPDDPDYGFENVAGACGVCHTDLTAFDRTARGDYDGDGDVEGVQDEVDGLLGLVFDELHAKGAVFLGHYPYWTTPHFCVGGIDDGQPCSSDTDCDLAVPGDEAGDCIAGPDEAVLKGGIWNYEYVDNDGSHGVHNTSYAVGLLQLSFEMITGGVLEADLRYTPEGGYVPTANYVGTDTCLTCHGGQAITGLDLTPFLRNGHSYKLNEVENAQMPIYPFSSIAGALELIDDDDTDPADPGPGTDNTLGTPLGYDEISFVIGGFGWKSRWIDADGYIITGTEVQYNLETLGMAAYHNNEVDKKYNCGNCHTTGWKRYTSEPGDTRNLNHQNGLPGMDGTFTAPGVHCEACHGAGSLHAMTPSAANITRVATPRDTADFLEPDMAYGLPVACSECHTRDGEKDYPTYVGGPGRIAASGGLVKHHEQYDEMIGIDPDDVPGGATGPHKNLPCVACHDPHTTTKYMDISDDAPGMNKHCTVCHNATGIGGKDYPITSGGMTGLDCLDCHMPKLAKSAVGHAAVGTGPITGDIRSHIFRIDLSEADQFTGDGSFAYPRITGDWACKTCHNNVDEFDLGFPSAQVIHEPLAPLAGFGRCAECHVSRPAGHVGLQDVDACGLCHVPYGSTTSPPHDATTTACIACHTTPEETHTYLRDDTDQTIFAPGADAECIACHRDGGYEPNGRAVPPLDTEAAILSALELGTLRAWLQPGGFMAKYMSASQVADTTQSIDTLSEARVLGYDPYLDAAQVATDFPINGLGDNAAWAGAGEHIVAVTPTIFTATDQVKLKALYSDTYLYVRAEWPDSTLSMTRGAWIYDVGTWRHPTASNQYEKQSEDRFSIIWNLTIPDFKDRYGCAVKCHGNVPGSSEYTDLTGSIADIWHSKAARGLGLYSATDNGALTVETAMESFEVTAGTAMFHGVLDDKWLIWYMDLADGYDTEDSGRRGDSGSSAYSHNRNAVKSSPKYMETSPLSWTDAMVLTQAEIDGGEVIVADVDDPGYNPVAVAAAWVVYTALDAVVPERVLRVPAGSRADVEHAATWTDGVWINEFKRQLLTGGSDDVQFNLSTATEYEFSIAVFDNCGRGEIPPGHTTYGDGQYQVLRFLP